MDCNHTLNWSVTLFHASTIIHCWNSKTFLRTQTQFNTNESRNILKSNNLQTQIISNRSRISNMLLQMYVPTLSLNISKIKSKSQLVAVDSSCYVYLHKALTNHSTLLHKFAISIGIPTQTWCPWEYYTVIIKLVFEVQ